MDQTVLVAAGQELVKLMDGADFGPRAAMWVHNTEADSWRLWIVPPQGVTDQREFFHRLVGITVPHQKELSGLDAASVAMVPDTHPAIQGLNAMLKPTPLGAVQVSSNMLNGYYLRDGIVLRMAV